MLVRFWGVRGSIPRPGPDTLRYGGDTACVEIRTDAGTLIVLDCGSGGHALGQALSAARDGPLRAAMLFSHTHWDHIQGAPFFAPFFAPGDRWDVYAPRGLGRSIRETLAVQMEYAYFPVTLDAMGAELRFHDLVEGTFEIGDARVSAQYLDHPALTLGYRIEADGAAVVYASDHEAVSRTGAPDAAALAGPESRHVAFLRDADLVIHDAQYTAEEYVTRAGWGHATGEYAVAVARAAGARRLLLTHHDPLRADEQMDALVAALRAASPPGGPEIGAAAVGLTVRLAGAGAPTAPGEDARRSAAPVGAIALGALRPDVERLIRAAAAAEGLEIADGAEGGEETAALVADAAADPEGARAALARRRADPARASVVLIADGAEPALDFGDAGQDWMLWPFSQQYAQARLRAAVLRAELRWARARAAADEPARLAALARLGVLDTPPDPRFDRVTRMAAAALDAPVAFVSFIDRDRQWVKSCFGAPRAETSRDAAFCAHTILEPDLLIVPDAARDVRFADNPYVAAGPRIRFYAGCPVRDAMGHAVGTLCVIDTRPRSFGAREKALLRDFAGLVEAELDCAG